MDLSITADLSALENLTGKYPYASAYVRTAKITQACLMLVAAIQAETPVGAGPIHLRDTLFHKIEQAGQDIWGLVSTPAAYGVPLEEGTKPHFPPVAPIRHWVEKKLGISGKEAKSVAYVIARAISRRGTKGAKMFGKSFRDHEGRVRAILESIPAEIVSRVAGGLGAS